MLRFWRNKEGPAGQNTASQLILTGRVRGEEVSRDNTYLFLYPSRPAHEEATDPSFEEMDEAGDEATRTLREKQRAMIDSLDLSK